MRVRSTPLISAGAIATRVREMAAHISERYRGSGIVMAVVLKGGYVFAADLARQIEVPVRVEFIRARSYRGTLSSGVVEFTVLPEGSFTGHHVLVVEDILDTGHTAAAVVDRIHALRPASVTMCTLLDKPARRVRNVEADLVGFTIDDEFVVGYGLDCDEHYRNLPAIHVLEPD